MKVTFVFFLFLFTFKISCDEIYPVYNDVLVITDATFTRALNELKYLLVFFYSPLCEECKNYYKEYEMASSTLKKENLFLAKIDGSVEARSMEKYSIDKYPTFIFFNKGKPREYKGGLTEKEIVDWMRENSIPDFKELNTDAEVEKFVTESEVNVIYFGNKEDEIKELKIAERKIFDIPFGIVKDEKIIKTFVTKDGVSSFISLFKNFDEKRNDLYDIKQNVISKFVENYSLPKVTGFDNKSAPIILGKRVPALVIFAQKNSPEWPLYKNILYSIADKYLGKMKMVLTDIDEGMAINLAEFAGVHSDDLPTVKIVDPTPENPIKFIMEGKEEINKEKLLKFIDDWEKRKLKPYLKTQEVPTEQYGDVMSIVGKNFKKEVIDNDKDVMVYFYAPWCEHCKENYPVYEKVAKKLRKQNPNLLMVKIDATENDVEGLIINRFPTIKFYPGNQKEKPFDYRKKSIESEYINFMKEKAFHKIIIEENEGVKLGNKKNSDL